MKKLLVGILYLTLLAGCAPSSAQPTASPTATAKKAAASGASVQGYVTPVHRADLAFRTGGRIVEILVKEGDVVLAGQPLVKLQDIELRAALAQAQTDLKSWQNGARPEEIAAAQANLDIAQGQLEVAQANLSRLQSGTLTLQLASAQADAARAAADLKVAQDSYDALVLGPGHGIATDANVPGRGLGKYEEDKRAQLAAIKASYDATLKQVTDAGVSASSSLQAGQASVDIAAAQRSAAQAKLNLLKAGTLSQQIDAATARVAQARAALDEATLVAPFDGTIAELTINLGEMALPGVRIASIADLTQWEVETDDLSEVDVVTVQAGTDVSITVDALPGVTLKGKVTSITPRSAVKRGDVTYTVKVAIATPEPRLKWGMTAYVDIHRR